MKTARKLCITYCTSPLTTLTARIPNQAATAAAAATAACCHCWALSAPADHYSKSDCAHACRCAVTAWGIYALSDPEMPELDDKQQVACAAYSLQVLQDKEVLSPGARAAFKGNCPYKACS